MSGAVVIPWQLPLSSDWRPSRNTGDLWVTYEPQDDCQCWRDALCAHGWTWQEDATCNHRDAMMSDVHVSVADAVRDLFSIRGAEAIGCLLRLRYSTEPPRQTMEWYVMPPGVALVDDHDAVDGPAPVAVIVRKRPVPRSRVGDKFRRFADSYRTVPLTPPTPGGPLLPSSPVAGRR